MDDIADGAGRKSEAADVALEKPQGRVGCKVRGALTEEIVFWIKLSRSFNAKGCLCKATPYRIGLGTKRTK